MSSEQSERLERTRLALSAAHDSESPPDALREAEIGLAALNAGVDFDRTSKAMGVAVFATRFAKGGRDYVTPQPISGGKFRAEWGFTADLARLRKRWAERTSENTSVFEFAGARFYFDAATFEFTPARQMIRQTW